MLLKKQVVYLGLRVDGDGMHPVEEKIDGAIISHVMDDGEERPIVFASRTLTGSERNYAKIEKALSLVFGVKRFHQFL